MENNPYKIIYKATLKLKTALHIGCAQKSPIGAFDIVRNGSNEPIIPGTSIAGVFLTTLKKVNNIDNSNNLYKKISETLINKNGKKNNRASSLVFRSVNFDNLEYVKVRNRTKINRETKTAYDKALYAYWEIEPENVKFDVIVEIDNLSLNNNVKDLKTFDNWIQNVFASWKEEGVFFGGHNTSGNGYCKLDKLKCCKISSEKDFENYLEGKETYTDVSLNKNENKYFKTWKITVDLNDNKYGADALLIKGGISHFSLVQNPSDAIFINTGKRLFIPGSSLKGTFSMFLEKYNKKNWLKQFFGQDDADHQGYIYFPDLIFNENQSIKKHLINIERHAEDEFTRAVLGSGKFNEERLFYETVQGYIRIPTDFYNENKKTIKELIEFLKEGCNKGLISLGANGCYPKIKIEDIQEDKNENN